jgi:hypothetical protein
MLKQPNLKRLGFLATHRPSATVNITVAAAAVVAGYSRATGVAQPFVAKQITGRHSYPCLAYGLHRRSVAARNDIILTRQHLKLMLKDSSETLGQSPEM